MHRYYVSIHRSIGDIVKMYGSVSYSDGIRFSGNYKSGADKVIIDPHVCTYPSSGFR